MLRDVLPTLRVQLNKKSVKRYSWIGVLLSHFRIYVQYLSNPGELAKRGKDQSYKTLTRE